MIAIKLAYYRKKDWKRFLNMIDDRDKMHGSWHDWHKAFQKTKRELINQGFEVLDVVVDLDELFQYCKTKGIKIDGSARSQFVQAK